MEIRDWIIIISALIVVIGWFVNSFLNRRNEIAKKRMEYRLDALLSFTPVLFAFQENRTNDKKFSEDMASCRTKFQLYCYSKEVEEFEKIVAAIENKNEKAYNEAFRQVTHMVRVEIRKELGLDKFEPVQK